jgi:hypothetical protein
MVKVLRPVWLQAQSERSSGENIYIVAIEFPGYCKPGIFVSGVWYFFLEGK